MKLKDFLKLLVITFLVFILNIYMVTQISFTSPLYFHPGLDSNSSIRIRSTINHLTPTRDMYSQEHEVSSVYSEYYSDIPDEFGVESINDRTSHSSFIAHHYYNTCLKYIHNGYTDMYVEDGPMFGETTGLDRIFLNSSRALYPKVLGVNGVSGEERDIYSIDLVDINGDLIDKDLNREKYMSLCERTTPYVSKLHEQKYDIPDYAMAQAVMDILAEFDLYVDTNSFDFSQNSELHNPANFFMHEKMSSIAYAGLLNVFMWELGIESYMVYSDTYAWNMIYLDGEWYHCDVLGGLLTDNYASMRVDDKYILCDDSLDFVVSFLGL